MSARFSNEEIISTLFEESATESYYGDAGRFEEELQNVDVAAFINERINAARANVIRFEMLDNFPMLIIDFSRVDNKRKIDKDELTLQSKKALKELAQKYNLDDDFEVRLTTSEPTPIVVELSGYDILEKPRPSISSSPFASHCSFNELLANITISNAKNSPKPYNINLGAIDGRWFRESEARIGIMSQSSAAIYIYGPVTAEKELTEEKFKSVLREVVRVLQKRVDEEHYDEPFFVTVEIARDNVFLISFDGDFFAYSRKTISHWEQASGHKMSIREQANNLGHIDAIDFSKQKGIMFRRSVMSLKSLPLILRTYAKEYFTELNDNSMLLVITGITTGIDSGTPSGSILQKNELDKAINYICNKISSCNSRSLVADDFPVLLVTAITDVSIPSSITLFHAAKSIKEPSTIYSKKDDIDRAVAEAEFKNRDNTPNFIRELENGVLTQCNGAVDIDTDVVPADAVYYDSDAMETVADRFAGEIGDNDLIFYVKISVDTYQMTMTTARIAYNNVRNDVRAMIKERNWHIPEKGIFAIICDIDDESKIAHRLFNTITL